VSSKREFMGRLKRKRPASAKKTGRKKAAKSGNRQQDTQGPDAAVKAPVKDSGAKVSAPVRKEQPKPVKSTKPAERRIQISWWAKGIQFLRESKVELKKVSWPSRKETMASTVVVIVLVIIVSAFLGLVDMGLSSLVGLVLQ
jgi:preprotein translocase subunit SecE